MRVLRMYMILKIKRERFYGVVVGYLEIEKGYETLSMLVEDGARNSMSLGRLREYKAL